MFLSRPFFMSVKMRFLTFENVLVCVCVCGTWPRFHVAFRVWWVTLPLVMFSLGLFVCVLSSMAV